MKAIPYVNDINRYLVCDQVIDFDNENIREVAYSLSDKSETELDYIKNAFEFVRDQIYHSADKNLDDIPVSASEVLEAGHGICFAKSHLLAALLRCKSIPTGLCYQKLVLSEEQEDVLIYHGLIGVYLKQYDKWIRLDARGNKVGVNAQFSIEIEQLAFPIREEKGERDNYNIYPDPDEFVLANMRTNKTRTELWKNLPTNLKYDEQ